MSAKISAGVIGGAGYAGGELIRLLLRHPNAQISFAQSESFAGKPLWSAHPDLAGETELRFAGKDDERANIAEAPDVLFLCLGHGDAAKFLAANAPPPQTLVIDLSQDFRYPPRDAPNEASGQKSWIYGLPELNKTAISEARASGANVANPGCFASCLQLGLLPLAAEGLLPDEIHASAVTGSTGAGQALAQTAHFSWRSNNVGVYKAFAHQHLREIRASLRALQPSFGGNVAFIPYRGSFTRGILAASYLKTSLSLDEALSLYARYYAPHPFTRLVSDNPDVKQVVNTNNCFVYIERHEDKLLAITAIDNLLKGASGQAVQNMNLAFGFEETAGLRLKASAF